MRTAIIADIHGNYPALMNVLKDAYSEHVDAFIFVGDYIFDLPFSNQVTQVLMEMKNAYIIKGNKEEFLCQMASEDPKYWIFPCRNYTFRELTPDLHDFLMGLDDQMHIRLSPQVSVYAAHISPIYGKPPQGSVKKKYTNSFVFHQAMLEQPFSHAEFLTEYHDFINSDICMPNIRSIEANVIIYAHNHLQSYAYCGDKLIINPGSCGVPCDFDTAAAYTILEETSGGLKVIEKRVAYDVEAVIRQTKESTFYAEDKVFCEMVFLMMRTGRDYVPVLYDLARKIAAAKNENDVYFSKATYAEAGEQFFDLYKI